MESARHADVEALKALAHPLRARLFNLLSVYGPSTASALAQRIGESSGSTSYHLRQLERHGFVREDPDRGNARDRWWERVPGPVEIGGPAADQTPATAIAAQMASSAINAVEEQLVRDFINYRQEALPAAWRDASDMSSAYLVLTAEQTTRMNAELYDVITRFRAEQQDPDTTGTARVFVQVRAFPVALDAAEPTTTDIPSEEEHA